MSRLSIVIPCYQNKPNLPALQEAILVLHQKLTDVQLQIITVDDGSTDSTWDGLLQMGQAFPFEHIVIKLAGNFVSYNAFLASLHAATGDYCVQLHADLQDPPSHIPEMLLAAKAGFKLVIGLRTDREEPWLSKTISVLYHRMVKTIALPHIPEGGYDLILFDKSIRDHIVHMNENNINLVYLISSLKHPYAVVPITRVAREKGRSQWTLSKKRKLWMDTVVGFSYTPIKWLTNFALFFLPLNIAFLLYVWIKWTSSSEAKIALSLVLACLQITLMGLAIVAEYLWRTLEASRKRPPFVVDHVISNQAGSTSDKQ